MRWRNARRSAPQQRRVESVLPPLRPAWWEVHNLALADARLLTIARRLPLTVARSLAVSWRANPRDTTLAVIANLAAGVAIGWGLLATRGVLQALFADGPTIERVRAAVPSLLFVATATALRAGLSIVGGWAQARLEPQVLTVVERRLFELTTRVELAAFDDAGFADEVERARNRGVTASQSMVRAAIDLLAGGASLVAAALAIGLLHPLLLAALLLVAAPTGWIAVRVARLAYLSMHARTSRRRRLWLLADLMIDRDTAAELRAFNLRQLLLHEYDAVVSTETAEELDVVRRQTQTRIVGGLFAGLATAAVYVVLGLLLVGGAIPLAIAGTAVLALQTARNSLALSITNVNRVYEEALYFGDYTEFCVRAAGRTPAGATVARVAAPRRIDLRHIGLRYPDTEAAAVADLSLTVHRGQTIALVGENGSGKTTLAKLIAGLYQPSTGTVEWDGVDVHTIEPERRWDHVGMVSQDYARWPFTAARNIAIGDPTQTGGAETDNHGDAIRAAARRAGAHQMILQLPAGYETLLSRAFAGGQDLSGGQWQRLAAARAFMRDAPILICDEPSAALDARAEHHLFTALRGGAAGRITILITHRLANVRHADRIYVMRGGSVVETGTHEELIAAGGEYAELFTLQAAGYAGIVSA